MTFMIKKKSILPLEQTKPHHQTHTCCHPSTLGELVIHSLPPCGYSPHLFVIVESRVLKVLASRR